MTCTLHVAWDERLTDYHFGPGHPMAPVRVELTMRLAHEFGLWSLPGVTVAVPAPAADADLELVHDAPYVAAVEAVSRWAEHPDASEGLDGDSAPGRARCSGWAPRTTRSFPPCTRRRRWLPGRPWPRPAPSGQARPSTGPASRAACITPWPLTPAGSASTTTSRSRSPGCWDRAPSASPTWISTRTTATGCRRRSTPIRGCRRSACTSTRRPCSRSPACPPRPAGLGAEGSAANVALPAGTRDARLAARLPRDRPAAAAPVPAAGAGQPARLRLAPAGSPGPHLELSIDGQRAAHAAIHALAHELAAGRWLFTGGGGYELVHVVPRTWTHLLAEAAGQPIAPGTPTPGPWREYVARRTGLDRTRADDGGGTGRVRAVRVRLRPSRSGRPGHHGHPPGSLPPERADAAMTATSVLPRPAIPLIVSRIPAPPAWRARS